jgi:CHAT domain-containing protein
LREARAETEAIAGVFRAHRGNVTCLIGPDATESAVFAWAPQARYLHFACHGVAGQHDGTPLSMLVLSKPPTALPGDDGLLQLDDLLHRWRGRLVGCRLVVLSACDTNVGATRRDDAAYALPLGFLFAGASAVVSSVWPVDDGSTRELMTDFYEQLLADESDPLTAFRDARRRLRARRPEPFYWAPFQFVGNP